MIYEFNSRIRFSEVDENGFLTWNSLVNYFQDTSSFQSEFLGIGNDYLKERGLAWIISFWQIRTERMPRLVEPATFRTWAYGFNGFFGLRNFDMLDSEGRRMAWANSVWVLLDLKRGRPVKVSDEMREKYGCHERLEMDYAPRKLTIPGQGEAREAFQIGHQQLDTNHHMNNGQYLSIASSYLPEDLKVREIRAEYRMQARLGDTVVPSVLCLGDTVWVSLNDPEGKAYAVIAMMGE